MQQEQSTIGYNAGNSSPLRTYSPKRGADNYDRPQAQTYNVTQVNKAPQQEAGYEQTQQQHRSTKASTHHYAAASMSCAAQPTEKERMIA